ncbi:hypothetical protein EV122DRAFT_267678, partial [Schizophyllum commune]
LVGVPPSRVPHVASVLPSRLSLLRTSRVCLFFCFLCFLGAYTPCALRCRRLSTFVVMDVSRGASRECRPYAV